MRPGRTISISIVKFKFGQGMAKEIVLYLPVPPFNKTHEHSLNQFEISALYLTLFLTIKGSRSHGISISYKLNQQMNFKGKKCIKNTRCKSNQNMSKVTIEENPYFRGKGRFDLIPKNIHV